MITGEDCLKIGEVTKTHGLQGNVIITTDNDLLERYVDEPVFLLLEGGPVPFFITGEGPVVRNHTSYIVKFDYVDTKQQAERLLGADVLIEKSLVEADGFPEDDYDIYSIIGFEAEDEQSGQKGEVTDVADYSGNIVLSIRIFGKEILLPFSEVYILQVDPEQKKLLVTIPPDILELY